MSLSKLSLSLEAILKDEETHLPFPDAVLEVFSETEILFWERQAGDIEDMLQNILTIIEIAILTKTWLPKKFKPIGTMQG